LSIVLLQLTLGVLAVLKSPNAKALLWLGVAHQFFAMALLLSLVFEFYLLQSKKKLIAEGAALSS
jgi:heme A synthase